MHRPKTKIEKEMKMLFNKPSHQAKPCLRNVVLSSFYNIGHWTKSKNVQ
jgi:hypothetical protein